MTPVMVTVAEQPSWAQSQQPSAEEIEATIIQLINQALQLQQQGKAQKAIEVWQEVLAISKKLQLKEIEAIAWLGIGRNSDDIGKPQAALEAYQQALPILQEVQDRRGEATTLNNLGSVYDSIGEPQQAIEYYQQALPILQEVQDRRGEATTLNNLGSVYLSIGEQQRAIEYYRQSLPISQEVQDWVREATTLNNLGSVYLSIGEPQQAIEYYRQALPILREVQDRRGEAATLNNLGSVYHRIGEPQQAIENYQQALPIVREVQNWGGEATTLNNLGSVYESIGELQRAIEYYQQALPIRQEVQDRRGEAATLNNLGSVYHRIGEPQQAIENYQQALPILQEVQDRGGEAVTLNGLGLVYESTGKLEEAIKYYQQALPIRREVQDRGGEAATLKNLGSVYYRTGKSEEAIKYYQQALPIFQEVQDRGGEAATLNDLGLVYNNTGQQQRAIECYQQALPILQEVQDRGGEATILSNMAGFYRDTKQPDKAIEHWEKSLEIILSLRSNLKQENRQSFIKINQGHSIALTSFLIQQNQPKEAYTWINRVTTYELADYTRLLGAKVQNPQAQTLIDEYNQRWQQIENLRRQLQLDSSDELSRRISTLETENIKLGEEIAQQFPEVADIFETTPTDIEQLQATIPEGILVLQPVPLANVTNVPNTLALFLLTRDSFQVVQTSLDVEQFNQLLDQYLEQLQDRSDTTYTETSAELYNILIRPIESQINAYQPQHLSIIATGQLRYLPFETLYDEEGDQQLIEKYPINYLTRLSKTPPNRQPSAKSNAILAFGNPVPHPPQHLPGAEAEVNTITQLFANSQAYLNHGATLEQFKTQAPKFAFLHLATHGCFQKDGCKKLDMAANTILFADTTWPITDAALLGLNHTRLIALSACQTAREADVEGNLISGVAYLFERAGAQAVMASLWNVADESTQRLMSDFYQYVQEGMTQGEALRKAKLNQVNRHPFFWSPFILIGDPR